VVLVFREKCLGRGSRESSTLLTVMCWKGDLVIRGYLTGVKLWGVRWLGVLSIVVGVLLGVVVGHDFCWPNWGSWRCL
jgi:hypothetical protein